MNLEACYLYKDYINNQKSTTKNRDLGKLFIATIPYSLETIRMDTMFETDDFYIANGKQYTKSIVNVTFDENYFKFVDNINKETGELTRKKKVVANKKKIRKHMYKNGFILDGQKYIFYKRGAGKAKNGYAFFIKEDMRERLINRSRLGLQFNENEEVDLTSLLAYESLISSGILYTIDLDPLTEILLIDDIYGIEFESVASVTRELNGELITNNETLKLQNCLSDGQGLMDESVFEKYGKQDKGMMLLRSDFFKCCAFNTKLQKWFEYNEVKIVKDMFGNEYDASKIKLVTTPNSLKFLKFAYKIGDGNKADCYEYWKNNIDSMFGVVKYDKQGNFGNYNRMTYQLLNSIPNLTYDDLMEITKEEREYVMLLKNDEAVFRNYIGGDAIASLRLEKAIESDKELDMLDNTELLSVLLLVNSDIQYTKKFKELKKDLIKNYISHLKEGKIRLKDTKYTTLVSNPYEMLLATIGKYEGKSIMKEREIYCNYYDDGVEFCISRNPHINAGNVMWAKNVYHEEYDVWFNLTENISCVNFYDNDMPDRLQGCDTDSDTFLTTTNKILSEKAKFCEENFATPINKVTGRAVPRKNNMEEMQSLDVVLSNNYIGKIVNMSQIFNSYLNDAIHRNADKSEVETLYSMSSRLSSMSQIEIDKSKKVFDNVNMGKELRNLRQCKYIKYVDFTNEDGEAYRKMVVPSFFAMISNSNDFREFKFFNTPLDILQEVLVFPPSRYKKGDKHKEMKDLLVPFKEVDGEKSNCSIIAIYKIIEECGKNINKLKVKTCKLNPKAKSTLVKKYKNDAILKLKKLTPTEATILKVIKDSFDNKEGFRKYSVLTLNLLFTCYRKQFLKCFKSKNMNDDKVLVKVKNRNDYLIFGNGYQINTRKSLKIQ